eukprot:10598903-Lingulodinium_polyedra.AAC.1
MRDVWSYDGIAKFSEGEKLCGRRVLSLCARAGIWALNCLQQVILNAPSTAQEEAVLALGRCAPLAGRRASASKRLAALD